MLAMLRSLPLWAALPSVGAAVYVLYSLWLKITHKVAAHRLGCKPAYARPCLPLGLDNISRALAAAKEQVLQNDDVAIYEEMGCPSTWQQNVLGTWYHTTVDPENIKAILATQFKDFEMGPLRQNLLGPLLGPGVFTSDGKEWSHYRALLRPQFTRSQISNLKMEEVHVQNLFNRFEHASNDSWTAPIDLAPLFFNLTMDSATEFLFGHSVDSQITYNPATVRNGIADSDKNDWSSFGRAFDRANATIAIKGVLMDLYFLYSPKSFSRDCKTVHEFADFFVQKALDEARAQEKDGNAAEASDDYVFLRELAKTTKDPYVLRSQLLNIFLAGRDTTAGLLGWTFYLLARHPEYYAQLHHIIVDTFGPYSEDTSSITFESLKACQKLQHLLSEVLRLHPVVPENSRRANKDTTLPRGGGPDGKSPIYIRKGDEVIYRVHVMHRRRDIWGDDANEFRPERWAGHKHGWEYLPFNGGPRICLGQQFALTEAAYVIARVLQKYSRIENLDQEKTLKHQFTLTTAPVKVLVKLHKTSE